MSGYTIDSPNTVFTTLINDGQVAGGTNPAGGMTPAALRSSVASAMSAVPSVWTSTGTIALTDAFTCIEYNSSSAGSLQIPTDASVAFQVGTVIQWCQIGTGQLTIVAVTPGTTTVRNPSSNTARVQNSSGAIRKRAANDWVLVGDVS